MLGVEATRECYVFSLHLNNDQLEFCICFYCDKKSLSTCHQTSHSVIEESTQKKVLASSKQQIMYTTSVKNRRFRKLLTFLYCRWYKEFHRNLRFSTNKYIHSVICCYVNVSCYIQNFKRELYFESIFCPSSDTRTL